MKKTINTLSALAIAAALAAGFTACTNEDNITDEPQQPAAVKTYQVSIPATMGDEAQTRAVTFGTDGTSISSYFAAGEQVYVWLERSGQYYAGFYYNNGSDHDFTTLSPTDISADGKTCTLSGALKFGHDISGAWTSIDPEVGDVLHLFYRMNGPDAGYLNQTGFKYYYQDGSASNETGAGSCDFAEETMKVKTVGGNATSGYTLELCQVGDETQTTAHFENIGSMFRQRLTFKNASNETVTPDIRKLTVHSKNNTLATNYSPFRDDDVKYYRSDIEITKASNMLSADGDVWLALMFRYDATHSATGDQLIVTAVDADRNVYQCTKDAPAGGFASSKYYHGAMAMTWQKQLATPTVTRNDGGEAIELVENTYISPKDGSTPIDITISGSSDGYVFYLWDAGTVTLAGGGTANYDKNAQFLYGNGDLTVNLAGNYTINCLNSIYYAIYVYDHNLKLSGNGTLNVTVKNAYSTGLYGSNYQASYSAATEIDPSALAADGYTVTRSAPTDNGDGTYTWSYTVASN